MLFPVAMVESSKTKERVVYAENIFLDLIVVNIGAELTKKNNGDQNKAKCLSNGAQAKG